MCEYRPSVAAVRFSCTPQIEGHLPLNLEEQAPLYLEGNRTLHWGADGRARSTHTGSRSARIVEEANVRVLLACEPPLLNELLALALAELPGVKLVEVDGAQVDVVIASAPGAGGERALALLQATSPHARLVALDPATNVLRVWENGREAPSGELLPGHLSTLGQLLGRWAAR